MSATSGPASTSTTSYRLLFSASVRLDAKTERTLERLARKMDASKSAVLRKAVDALARQSLQVDRAGSLYERAQDLIGCVSGGTQDLSTRTGAGFRRMLAEKGNR